MGLTPRVLIWKAGTRFTLGSLPDLQKNAVGCLAFSNDNIKLATVSLDPDHTVSIYQWRLGLLLCRVNGGARRLLHITFSPDDSELLAVGLKTIVSFSAKQRSMVATRANIDAVGSLWQTFYVGAYFADRQVVATNDGNLYCIGNGLLTDNIKVHKGPIYTMDVNNDRTNLVTGGRDGLLKIWNTSIECIKEIKIDSVFPVVSSRLRSVCFSRKNQSIILVGTGGAEIMEINTKDNSLVGGKPILQSHGCRELWGLAPHPTKPEFVTAGDDCTIRIWDSRSNAIVRTIKMDAPSRAVAYSPDGKFLVIGFGSGKKLTGKKKVNKNGAFIVLSTTDFKLATEVKDSAEPIRCVKFSSDSKLLAVASEDSKIYVYSVKDQYAKRCIITNHRAPITTFDFSQDGSMIMSVDSSKRMCFSETIGGTHVTSSTVIRDEKWSTWTSPIGWHVRGLWYFEPQGVETISAQRSWNGMLLAAGTNVGRVFVVKYPCPEKAGFVTDSAHCGPISQIAWCAGDGTIVTTGSRDHSILQWRCVYDNARESGDEGGRSCEDSEEGRDGGQELPLASIERTSQAFGKHAMAWTANIAAPVKVIDDDLEIPKISAEPEFLFGNRLSDSRQMLKYNRAGNIICAASNFGIVYDRMNHRETFYTGHKNMIISLDVTCDGLLVATGDLAKDPELHFWDALTALPLSKVESIHRGGITAISFSSSGLQCITLGQDILNSITVLLSPTGTWKDPQIMASVSIGRAKMLWVQYIDNNNFPIVVGGHHSMYFFKQAGSSLERTKGVFGRRQKIQTILCGCVGTEIITNGEKQKTLITGTVTGHLYLWLNGRLQSRITAHDSSVYSVTNFERGFISGGKDGKIKIWNETLEPVFHLDVESFAPQPYFIAVHSLKVNMIQTKLVVGKLFNQYVLLNIYNMQYVHFPQACAVGKSMKSA
jgi:microtubule-associated protein-like 6